MIRSIRPLVSLVLNVRVQITVLSRASTPRRVPVPAAPPRAANDDGTRGWTLGQLADHTGAPEFLVARTARELGFEGLVFDAEEAAAIVAALRGDTPPRSA
jgi:hypothetical protein